MSSRNERTAFGPEELVRQENKVLNVLRVLLVIILIVVGSSLSLSCYKVTSKWEEERYQDDFDSISSRFVHHFRNALTDYFWDANTMSIAISANPDNAKVAPNITIPLFDKLSVGILLSNNLNNVFWSPLIRDGKARNGWEAFAKQQIGTNSSEHNQCFVCGSAELEVGLTNAIVELPFGMYTCENLDWAGLSGVVQEEDCSTLVTFVQAACQCRPGGQGNITNQVQTYSPQNGSQMYEIIGNATRPVNGSGASSPIWQVFPAGDMPIFSMYDLYSDPVTKEAIDAMIQTQQPVITKSFDDDTPTLRRNMFGTQDSARGNLMLTPVVVRIGDITNVIGSIVFDVDWAYIAGATVPMRSKGIQLVLENSSGQQRTFRSNGHFVEFVGVGDLHDPSYSDMLQASSFDDYRIIQSMTASYTTGKPSQLDCAYRIKVYSSPEFHASFMSHKPRLYALVVFMIFVFTSITFLAYDCYVARRQRKVMNAVLQRDEIMTSLFPAAIHERLFTPAPANHNGAVVQFLKTIRSVRNRTSFRRSFLTSNTTARLSLPRSDPIAEYFPMVSIVFADISGFTAWCSEREPSQVFELLETVYQVFDKLVNRMGIFKVETTGDCYVAAAGIPCYQPDHAVRAVKFAFECVLHIHELTQQLESTLGPNTSSLSIRVGVHSGSIIGGVLRGDKYRFQLFGDTMNTTSRMQTTGEVNKIQISGTTARFLEEADKASWIKPRDVPVRLKGKGVVQTFWADPLMPDDESYSEIRDFFMGDETIPWGETRLSCLVAGKSSDASKIKRLVEWNTDLLMRLLKKVVADRSMRRRRRSSSLASGSTRGTPFDQVVEVLPLEEFSEKAAKIQTDLQLVEINENVRSQLFDYVAEIASLYHDNPFHDFEHASHVAMSAAKVLMRIVNPTVFSDQGSTKNRRLVALKRQLHNSTFGISSDMLLQFAIVFSSVVHDVDHTEFPTPSLSRRIKMWLKGTIRSALLNRTRSISPGIY